MNSVIYDLHKCFVETLKRKFVYSLYFVYGYCKLLYIQQNEIYSFKDADKQKLLITIQHFRLFLF